MYKNVGSWYWMLQTLSSVNHTGSLSFTIIRYYNFINKYLTIMLCIALVVINILLMYSHKCGRHVSTQDTNSVHNYTQVGNDVLSVIRSTNYVGLVAINRTKYFVHTSKTKRFKHIQVPLYIERGNSELHNGRWSTRLQPITRLHHWLTDPPCWRPRRTKQVLFRMWSHWLLMT